MSEPEHNLLSGGGGVWGWGEGLRTFRRCEATTVNLLDLLAQLPSAVVYATEEASADGQNLGSRSDSGDEADA